MNGHDKATGQMDLINKLDDRYEPKHKTASAEPSPQKKLISKVDVVIIAVIIVACGYFVLFGDIDEFKPFQERIFGTPPVTPKPIAEVELLRFSDLSSNTSVNVELAIINIGDKTAKDISIFARARNQNGTVLFSGNISLTVVLLRANESCSGVYSVLITQNETRVFHTLELKWSDGTASYHKETIL